MASFIVGLVNPFAFWCKHKFSNSITRWPKVFVHRFESTPIIKLGFGSMAIRIIIIDEKLAQKYTGKVDIPTTRSPSYTRLNQRPDQFRNLWEDSINSFKCLWLFNMFRILKSQTYSQRQPANPSVSMFRCNSDYNLASQSWHPHDYY